MHINRLCIPTKRGSLLSGALFEDGSSDSVLICITGLHGNSFTNPFLRDAGRKIAKSGINFILAETSDAYPSIESFNVKTGKPETLGSRRGRLEDSIDDIGSYITKAEGMGYKHIYLAGHCLGASKVVHYLATIQDKRVEHFVLFSPGDHGQFMSELTENEKEYVLKEMEQGHEDEMLPFALMGWFNCSVGTAYDYVNDKCIIYVASADKEPPNDDLKRLNLSGMFVIGDGDVYAIPGPLEYLQKINADTPESDVNELIVIEGADHIYQGKGEALAEGILPILHKWSEK